MTNPAAEPTRSKRREIEHAANRAAILAAARRVASRDGAAHLSLRGVAAEAGYAPAALYGYFANKNELLLALAAEDLSGLARKMRDGASERDHLGSAIAAAMEFLQQSETMAAVPSAFTAGEQAGDAERQFNGRMIAALMALAESIGGPNNREAQADTLLLAASLAGIALFSRSGRLAALGFTTEEMMRRLERHFRPAAEVS
ncbi:MAG TPA: TetR family transcriptional regulator [Rhizomicrobium sp.]|jgi:AcrR family transcriptional regulator